MDPNINNLNNDDKISHLCGKPLSSNRSSMFTTFCDILSTVGRRHIADRLPDDSCHVLLSQQNSSHGEKLSTQRNVEILLAKIRQLEETVHWERGNRKKQEQRADFESDRAQRAEERAVLAEQRAILVESRVRVEKKSLDEAGEQMTGDASWQMRQNTVPSRVLVGSLAEHKGNLLIGGKGGEVHVVTGDGHTCDTFVKYKSDIRRVVCNQGLCLVLLEDEVKRQFVIEELCTSERKWRHITVLPDELQLSCVSIALDGNLLYAVAGMRKSSSAWERVSTARVFNLQTGRWYELEDMLTKRSGCSCVILNDTVFVSGGWSDNSVPCRTVECLRKGSGHWEVFASNPTPMSTMTAVGSKLMSAGGENDDYSGSNEVTWFDERLRQWLPLPRMIRRRSWHGLISRECGEITAAGGEMFRIGDLNAQSMESVKFT